MAVTVTAVAACIADDPAGLDPDVSCIVPVELLVDDGLAKDAIPALTDPELVQPGAPGASYVGPDDRVVGVVIDGEAIAIPQVLLNWHEVVNFDRGGRRLAVTYCPLTGSAIAFDRAAISGGEFGVTGFLFHSNLVMYDRTRLESLWPQMSIGPVCGPRAGQSVPTYPVLDMPLDAWLDLYPDTRIVSSDTGFDRNYWTNVFRRYQELHDVGTGRGFGPLDPRRPPKERVLGLGGSDGEAVAVPFLALDSLGFQHAQELTVDGEEVVVFWERVMDSAVAFRPEAAGSRLTFTVRFPDFVDLETGSTWRFDGVAVDGPLEGERLAPVPGAYVAFWFAWAAFHPETRIWSAPTG